MGGADSAHYIDHSAGPLSRLDASVGACGTQLIRIKVDSGHHERAAVDGKVKVGAHTLTSLPSGLSTHMKGGTVNPLPSPGIGVSALAPL